MAETLRLLFARVGMLSAIVAVVGVAVLVCRREESLPFSLWFLVPVTLLALLGGIVGWSRPSGRVAYVGAWAIIGLALALALVWLIARLLFGGIQSLG